MCSINIENVKEKIAIYSHSKAFVRNLRIKLTKNVKDEYGRTLN